MQMQKTYYWFTQKLDALNAFVLSCFYFVVDHIDMDDLYWK